MLPSADGVTVYEPTLLPEVSVIVPFFRVQAVAFVELHERTDEPPTVSVAGFAESVAVGAGVATGIGFTVTVTALSFVPPRPVQVAEYVVKPSTDG